MKNLGALQVLPSAQAYRASLRGYVQIGISERGKAGTLSVCTRWSGDYEKSVNETSSLYLAESGGMTNEAVIISCGGIAASHLQKYNSKKQYIKGSSKTKKGESRLWQEGKSCSNAKSWGITNTMICNQYSIGCMRIVLQDVNFGTLLTLSQPKKILD